MPFKSSELVRSYLIFAIIGKVLFIVYQFSRLVNTLTLFML